MQFSSLAVALGLALVSFQAAAQSAPEALIRKNLPARLSNFPAIDEIKPAPIAGLYEVRLNGADIVYTDARGDFLIQLRATPSLMHEVTVLTHPSSGDE